MMADEGTSDRILLPSSFGIQPRDQFQGRPLPNFPFGTSGPSSSNYLHQQPLPNFPLPVDHHPAASFRQDGWPIWDSGDTRGRVGEGEWSQCLSDVLLTFPEGEDGAVTITASDFAGLQPSQFLSDNTVDFYTKYLSLTVLSSEDRKRFHFFNSFFFTKLLENTASTESDQCKVDYEQLRKWTGGENLFEKDYVFIPVIERSHWSLVVVCYLSSLNPSSPDEKKGAPCILHLDPFEGQHESFEGQVRSHIFQAWTDRFQASENMNHLLHSLCQMKYVEVKVPQQGNGYDCGLYLLHYIEVFLRNSTSQDLRFSSSEAGAHFTSPNFEQEISGKRMSIRKLILELRRTSQEQGGKRLDIQPKCQARASVVHRQRRQPTRLPKPPEESKSKKWKEQETSALLECMVAGGRFCKGKHGAMNWDLVAKEINGVNKNGSTRSKDQCQNRFDTLLKAYKELNAYCVESEKKFSEVTEGEKRKLKLATPLKNEEWYNQLRDISHRRGLAPEANSRKRVKVNCGGDSGIGALPSSSRNPSRRSAAPSSPNGSCEFEEPCRKQVIRLGSSHLHILGPLHVCTAYPCSCKGVEPI